MTIIGWWTEDKTSSAWFVKRYNPWEYTRNPTEAIHLNRHVREALRAECREKFRNPPIFVRIDETQFTYREYLNGLDDFMQSTQRRERRNAVA